MNTVAIMGGGRGLMCAKCKNSIDRYSDVIICVKCDASHHLGCENVSIEEYRKLNDTKEIKAWECSQCMDITSANNENENKDEETSGNLQPNLALTPGIHTLIKTEVLAKENEFLKRENELLKQLVLEITDKNKLLEEKLNNYRKPTVTEEIAHKNKDTQKVRVVQKSKVSEDTPRKVSDNVQTVTKPSVKPVPNNTPAIIGKRNYRDETSQASSSTSLMSSGPATEIENKIGDNKMDETEFTTVNYRKKRKEHIVGTGPSDATSGFQAASANAWLYIGHIKATITKEVIFNYVRSKLNDENIIIEEINIIGPNKAFKLGINMKHKEQLYNPAFWPNGIIIRRYNFNFFRNHKSQKQDWNSTPSKMQN